MIRECYDFIGVDDTFVPKEEALNTAAESEAIYPVNWLGAHYAYCSLLARHLVKKYCGARLPRFFTHTVPVQLGLCKSNSFNDKIRRELDDYFKPEVAAVEKVLGREIPLWHRVQND